MLIDYYHFEGPSRRVPVNLPFAGDKPFLDLVAGDAILSFGSTCVGETLSSETFRIVRKALVSGRCSKALCVRRRAVAAAAVRGHRLLRLEGAGKRAS